MIYLWIRVGDGGSYERFDEIRPAVEYCNSLGVGRITGWVNGPHAIGFETDNFSGQDCVSCYWGGEEGDLYESLHSEERTEFADGMIEVYN